MLFGKRERIIRRILIVEDEPLVAFDNEYMLGDAGYEIVGTVDNLADAARALNGGGTVDLVLSDISLSGDGSGLDVARAAAERSVPVLFVTADCPPEAHGLGLGCLAKPYSGSMLKAALAAVDRTLAGNRPKRIPAGLTLFDVDAAA